MRSAHLLEQRVWQGGHGVAPAWPQRPALLAQLQQALIHRPRQRRL